MKNDLQSLSVNGIEFWRDDRGQGQPLVFVHGFPLDHAMWAEQIEAVASHARVIAPDLRGFGRSSLGKDAEKITMEQFADDLAAMLDALGICQPVVLCGLSMGGYIALQFWRKYAARLRGLIFCDTRAAADPPAAAAARLATADRVLREGAGPMVEAMLPHLLAETTRQLHPHVVENVRRMMMSASANVVAAAQRGMAERPDMTAALGQIACPTLVLVGREDAASPPAEMLAMSDAIPGSRFVEIPEAGHLSPLENPSAVNAAILEWLSGL